MLERILFTLLLLTLIVWVGGAVTGQIWMFRAGCLRDASFRASTISYINWIIRRVYIPCAATALTCLIAIAWLQGVPLTQPWLAFFLVVFLGTIIMGSVYSLPEYARLSKLIEEQGAGRPELERRIEIAAWLNRVELALVVIGLVGMLNTIALA